MTALSSGCIITMYICADFERIELLIGKGDTMVFFITFIRAISAMIITNAHYTGVYPTDLIANGGLLGDVLFFAVSGYCLTNVKLSFGKWYVKRFLRIYPPVFIITVVYALTGFYKISGFFDFIKFFIYPTYYHFVASILFLYIPYYLVMKIDALRKRLPLVLLVTLGLELIVYLLFFDRSTYHIDNVYSPMIWFLFFSAMLIGAYVKQNDDKYRNNNKAINIIMALVLCVGYFASKMLFVKFSDVALVCNLQILNQVILLALLYFLFAVFAGIDSKLDSMPKWIKAVLSFIGSMTLEIYLVQYVLIPILNIGPFPVNWIIITAAIIASAFVLHFVSGKVIGFMEKVTCLSKK